MITNISIVTVWVRDIDASKAFYTDLLGFHEHSDVLVGAYRWCTVNHPTQPELQVHLSAPGPPLSPDMTSAIERSLGEGGMPALGLDVDDCHKTVADLADRGVEVVKPAEDRPYGVEAVVRDNSGNWLVLVEPRPRQEEDIEESELEG